MPERYVFIPEIIERSSFNSVGSMLPTLSLSGTTMGTHWSLKYSSPADIKEASLQNAIELEPDHAEAHTAMGMYHAEIISKVGKMLGKVTYGASAGKALEHFDHALELTPDSPIAHIEYGNGLYLLFEDDRIDEVTDLYVKATELKAKDAMEKLDIEAALAEF